MPPYLLEYVDTMSIGSVADQNLMIGGTYNTYQTTYDRRVIPAEVAVVAMKQGDIKEYLQLKNRLANGLNLNCSGTLIYQNENGSYFMRVRPVEIPPEQDKIGSNARYRLSFESTELPLWRDSNEVVTRMGNMVGGIRFPLKFDKTVTFGKIVNNFAVINDTTYDLPVKFLIIGPAPMLTIRNLTTGMFLCFNREIYEGQQIEIDTERRTAVIKDATTGRTLYNANQFLTLDSEYFALQRGRNEIELDGGSTTKPLGYMFWNKLYGGV